MITKCIIGIQIFNIDRKTMVPPPTIISSDVECPTQPAIYKELRTRVMKFLGTRKVEFDDAKDVAAEFYSSIAGDIEGVSLL